MISEIIVAGGLLFIATLLPLNVEVFNVVGLIGSAVLLYFAWSIFQLRSVKVHDEHVLFTPSKILLLSATNAPLYVFWTTICFPLIWQLARVWRLPLAAFSYFVTFEIGWAITTFTMLLLFLFSRKTLTNEGIMHKVFISIALILAILGMHIFIQSVQSLI
jgi:threonine/homoserine/homoserine lactone efflux protein